MSQTVGSFLKEKFLNMCNWLEAEGLEINAPMLQEVQIVAIIQDLNEQYSGAIFERDFDMLLADFRDPCNS